MSSAEKPLQVLVIECQGRLDWFKVFEGATLPNGRRVIVDQAEMTQIQVTSHGDRGGCVCTLNKARVPLEGSPQGRERTIQVDFALVRSVSRGLPGQDSRNVLFGLMHAGLPAVNSLESCYVGLERVTMWGALVRAKRNLKRRGIAFPLIDQTYYMNARSMVVTPDLPVVAKIGHFQAAAGKARLQSPDALADFKSLLLATPHHATIEPYVKWDFDLRVQAIGDQYRAFRRRTDISWKGNTGMGAVIEDIPVAPEWVVWIEALRACLPPGADILSLDLLHSETDGKLYILEANETATGLVHRHADDDMRAIRDLVLRRMYETFYPDAIDGYGEGLQQADGHAADSAAIASSDEARTFASSDQAQLASQADEMARLRARISELETEAENQPRRGGLFGLFK